MSPQSFLALLFQSKLLHFIDFNVFCGNILYILPWCKKTFVVILLFCYFFTRKHQKKKKQHHD